MGAAPSAAACLRQGGGSYFPRSLSGARSGTPCLAVGVRTRRQGRQFEVGSQRRPGLLDLRTEDLGQDSQVDHARPAFACVPVSVGPSDQIPNRKTLFNHWLGRGGYIWTQSSAGPDPRPRCRPVDRSVGGDIEQGFPMLSAPKATSTGVFLSGAANAPAVEAEARSRNRGRQMAVESREGRPGRRRCGAQDL